MGTSPYTYLCCSQTLAGIVQEARKSLEGTLSQMDKGIGISFDNDFNFALSALLFKGWLSTLVAYFSAYILLLLPPSPRVLSPTLHCQNTDTGTVDNSDLHTQP